MELKLVIDATPQLIEALNNVATALRGGSPAAQEVKEEAPKKAKAKSKPVEEETFKIEPDPLSVPTGEKLNASVIQVPIPPQVTNYSVEPVVESTATEEALANTTAKSDAPAPKKYSLEECTARAKVLIEEQKHAVVKKALDTLGVKAVSKLEAHQYADFINLLN